MPVVYRVKAQFWWWQPTHTILDEQGTNVVYSLHRKWMAMDQAMAMIDEQTQPPLQGDNNVPSKETVLTLRKKILALGPVYEVVRNDNVVAASIQKRKLSWFAQQERHVLELLGGDVQYVFDESYWRNKNQGFVIQAHPGGEELARVYKKRFDWSGAFWIQVQVDPSYYEGEAFKDMCATVLAACILMMDILVEKDKQAIRLKQQADALKRKLKNQQQT